MVELEQLQSAFDARLAAMSDEEIVQFFKERGLLVEIQRQPPPMEGIQKQCWDAMAADRSCFEEDDRAFLAAVDRIVKIPE